MTVPLITFNLTLNLNVVRFDQCLFVKVKLQAHFFLFDARYHKYFLLARHDDSSFFFEDLRFHIAK